MKKALLTFTTILFSFVVLYTLAFFILGWIAPHNSTINKFYSTYFYSLRKITEARHLNKLDTFEGKLNFSSEGKPGLRRDTGTGIGFITSPAMDEEIAKIPKDARVRIYIGRALDKDSIGVYHYELRNIEVITDPKE